LREFEIPSTSDFCQFVKIVKGAVENIRLGRKIWHALIFADF
jgi:hypothetical protein